MTSETKSINSTMLDHTWTKALAEAVSSEPLKVDLIRFPRPKPLPYFSPTRRFFGRIVCWWKGHNPTLISHYAGDADRRRCSTCGEDFCFIRGRVVCPWSYKIETLLLSDRRAEQEAAYAKEAADAQED